MKVRLQFLEGKPAVHGLGIADDVQIVGRPIEGLRAGRNGMNLKAWKNFLNIGEGFANARTRQRAANRK